MYAASHVVKSNDYFLDDVADQALEQERNVVSMLPWILPTPAKQRTRAGKHAKRQKEAKAQAIDREFPSLNSTPANLDSFLKLDQIKKEKDQIDAWNSLYQDPPIIMEVPNEKLIFEYDSAWLNQQGVFDEGEVFWDILEHKFYLNQEDIVTRVPVSINRYQMYNVKRLTYMLGPKIAYKLIINCCPLLPFRIPYYFTQESIIIEPSLRLKEYLRRCSGQENPLYLKGSEITLKMAATYYEMQKSFSNEEVDEILTVSNRGIAASLMAIRQDKSSYKKFLNVVLNEKNSKKFRWEGVFCAKKVVVFVDNKNIRQTPNQKLRVKGLLPSEQNLITEPDKKFDKEYQHPQTSSLVPAQYKAKITDVTFLNENNMRFPKLKISFQGGLVIKVLTNPILDTRCGLLPIIQKVAMFSFDIEFMIKYIAYVTCAEQDMHKFMFEALVTDLQLKCVQQSFGGLTAAQHVLIKNLLMTDHQDGWLVDDLQPVYTAFNIFNVESDNVDLQLWTDYKKANKSLNPLQNLRTYYRIYREKDNHILPLPANYSLEEFKTCAKYISPSLLNILSKVQHEDATSIMEYILMDPAYFSMSLLKPDFWMNKPFIVACSCINKMPVALITEKHMQKSKKSTSFQIDDFVKESTPVRCQHTIFITLQNASYYSDKVNMSNVDNKAMIGQKSYDVQQAMEKEEYNPKPKESCLKKVDQKEEQKQKPDQKEWTKLKNLVQESDNNLVFIHDKPCVQPSMLENEYIKCFIQYNTVQIVHLNTTETLVIPTLNKQFNDEGIITTGEHIHLLGQRFAIIDQQNLGQFSKITSIIRNCITDKILQNPYVVVQNEMLESKAATLSTLISTQLDASTRIYSVIYPIVLAELKLIKTDFQKAQIQNVNDYINLQGGLAQDISQPMIDWDLGDQQSKIKIEFFLKLLINTMAPYLYSFIVIFLMAFSTRTIDFTVICILILMFVKTFTELKAPTKINTLRLQQVNLILNTEECKQRFQKQPYAIKIINEVIQHGNILIQSSLNIHEIAMIRRENCILDNNLMKHDYQVYRALIYKAQPESSQPQAINLQQGQLPHHLRSVVNVKKFSLIREKPMLYIFHIINNACTAVLSSKVIIDSILSVAKFSQRIISLSMLIEEYLNILLGVIGYQSNITQLSYGTKYLVGLLAPAVKKYIISTVWFSYVQSPIDDPIGLLYRIFSVYYFFSFTFALSAYFIYNSGVLPKLLTKTISISVHMSSVLRQVQKIRGEQAIIKVEAKKKQGTTVKGFFQIDLISIMLTFLIVIGDICTFIIRFISKNALRVKGPTKQQQWAKVSKVNKMRVQRPFAPKLINKTIDPFKQMTDVTSKYIKELEDLRVVKTAFISLKDDDKFMYQPFNIQNEHKPKMVNQDFESQVEALLSRHLAHKCQPDLKIWKKFEKYSKRQATIIAKQMYEVMVGDNYSITDYIADRKGSKKAQYQRIYDQTKSEFQKVGNNLEFMLKKNELLFGPDEKVKSRAIWNPTDLIKLYGGYINWRLLKALKKVSNNFYHGLSMSKLEKHIKNDIRMIPDKTFVWYDGSNHDSSQTAAWIKAVDNTVMNHLMPLLLTTTEDDWFLIYGAYVASTKLSRRVKFMYAPLRETIFSATLSGTVTSGHPTNTTLGNSLRVIIMAMFLRDEAKIPKKYFHVAVQGDDTMITISNRYKTQLIDVIKKYIYIGTPEDVITYGIGYVAKEVSTSRYVTEFLSKNIFLLGEEVNVLKKPDRLLQQGQFTLKVDALTPQEYRIATILANSYDIRNVRMYMPLYTYYQKQLQELCQEEKVCPTDTALYLDFIAKKLERSNAGMKLAYKMRAALEETAIKRPIYDNFITTLVDPDDEITEQTVYNAIKTQQLQYIEVITS